MVDHGLVTLVAGKPGHILNGLCSLLKAHPGLSVMVTANDICTLMNMVNEYHPKLVFLDYSLPGERVLEMVRTLKHEYASLHCIVIVENMQQYHAALKAGADEALQDNVSVDRLFGTIDHILRQQPLPV